MVEQNEEQPHPVEPPTGSSSPAGDTGTGDPGRTPGSAEGDRETVEEDLREKNL